ncbi:hypothetical protein E1A91_A05G313500v1, partial [Gossypium mustelinum]
MSNGSEPLKWFDDKFTSKISFKLQKLKGIDECNLLEDRSTFLREIKSPKHAGKGPSSSLAANDKPYNLFRPQSSCGIGPCSLFPVKSKSWIFFNLPIVLGIDPLNSLLEKSKYIALFR